MFSLAKTFWAFPHVFCLSYALATHILYHRAPYLYGSEGAVRWALVEQVVRRDECGRGVRATGDWVGLVVEGLEGWRGHVRRVI